MSQQKELTRFLTANGFAFDADGKESYFLFTNERSSLISKQWTGNEFGKKELIADNIRPDSSAAYIITNNKRVIFAISADSSLRAIEYDDEEEDWLNIKGLPQYKVHPDGQLAGYIGIDGKRHALFQDTSGRLVSLDEAWTPTTLPVDAAIGTPIGTTIGAINTGATQFSVFYLGKDNLLHVIEQGGDGKWGKDAVFAQSVFDGKLKRIGVILNEESKFVAGVLTEKKGIFVVTHGAEDKLSLGTVGADGQFVPGTDAECGIGIGIGCVVF